MFVAAPAYVATNTPGFVSSGVCIQTLLVLVGLETGGRGSVFAETLRVVGLGWGWCCLRFSVALGLRDALGSCVASR